MLSDAPRVQVVDDREGNYFPIPCEATGQDAMLVGRMRGDRREPDPRR
jgi:aspartate-semialdehyde dehydrogenase